MDLRTINDSVMSQESRAIAYLRALADALETQGNGVHLANFYADISFSVMRGTSHQIDFCVEFMGDKGEEEEKKISEIMRQM